MENKIANNTKYNIAEELLLDDLVQYYREVGFQVDESDEVSDEVKSELEDLRIELTEAGYTKAQSRKFIELQKRFLEDALEQYGLKVDPEAERSALESEWGNDTETKYKAIERWARENLSEDVIKFGLLRTAEGAKLLDKLMQSAEPTV